MTTTSPTSVTSKADPVNWATHEHAVGILAAVGLRGCYTVQRLGPSWLLQGVGHDELPLPGLPPSGRMFATLDAAQAFAAGVERLAPEVQVSGA